MSNSAIPSIAPSPKLDAIEAYLEDNNERKAARPTARRAFSAGYEAGLEAAAKAIRELIADAEHRADVHGIAFDYPVALETLAADLDASDA